MPPEYLKELLNLQLISRMQAQSLFQAIKLDGVLMLTMMVNLVEILLANLLMK